MSSPSWATCGRINARIGAYHWATQLTNARRRRPRRRAGDVKLREHDRPGRRCMVGGQVDWPRRGSAKRGAALPGWPRRTGWSIRVCAVAGRRVGWVWAGGRVLPALRVGNDHLPAAMAACVDELLAG
jgi:hypothetical protein